MEQLTYFKSIILGLIQGLTEFLPVSSSAHIMLAEEIFGLKLESGLAGAFTVMLHLGTLVAVVAWYFKRIIKMLAHPVKGEIKYLILATIPTVLFVLALKYTGWDDVIDSVAFCSLSSGRDSRFRTRNRKSARTPDTAAATSA